MLPFWHYWFVFGLFDLQYGVPAFCAGHVFSSSWCAVRDGLSSFSFLYDSFFCGALSSPEWEKEISFWAQVQGSGYSLSADW